MTLTTADKKEIKQIPVDVLNGGNPGLSKRFVSKEVCAAKMAGVRAWSIIVMSLLALTFTAAAWAAVKATTASLQVESLIQVLDSPLMGTDLGKER